ncbi:MAG: Nif11-like leader peptide family RiPP precursor [Candidatus Nanopelagicales bacterium]
MSRDQLEALHLASQEDQELHAALEAAETTEAWIVVANAKGFAVTVEDLPSSEADRELSDAELEGAAGGYTFPPTDWIYCDNPWTNYWCTLKC